MSLALGHALAFLAALSAASYAVCVGLFLFVTRRTIRRDAPRRAYPARARPPVSVLKPCAGVDDELERCLESFCRLDYPAFELLCGVRDVHDPAVQILQRVRRRHPRVAFSVVLTAAGTSPNPKVAQLEILAQHARHEVLWISDSNTLVHPDTLTAMVDDLARPGIGVVVSPIVGAGEATAGAVLDSLQLAAFVTLGTCVLHALSGRVVGPGKSVLLRRASLEGVGGFGELGRYCAEDFVLFAKLRARGERAALGRHVVASVNTAATTAEFAARHLRWSQLNWAAAFPGVVFEPFITPVFFALVAFLGAPGVGSADALAAVAALQLVGDLTVLVRLRGAGVRPGDLWLVAVRPLCFVALWARAAVSRRVIWRGHVRWLGPDTAILDEPPLRARVRALRAALRTGG